MPCPASTKLMRSGKSGSWTTTVPQTGGVLVPFDAHRVALIISPPQVNSLYLNYQRAATSTDGIILTVQTTLPLVLTLGDHGPLVQGPIFARAVGANETITCWDSSVGPIE